MTKRRWRMAAVGLALALPAQAQDPRKPRAVPVAPQAVTSPLKPIYRVPGVRDNGAADNAGLATIFSCSSFSAVDENIRFVVRQFEGSIVKDATFLIGARDNVTASTHSTISFADDVNLQTGELFQGTASISATSVNIHCSAILLDASAAIPNFAVALPTVRLNQAPGTHE